MSAVELCIHDKRYRCKRTDGEDDGYVSNCTLKMIYPVHAGEKTRYVGVATHWSGSEK